MDKRTAEKIVSMALDMKADAAEVFLRSRSSTTVEVKEQRVDAFESADDAGAGLRVLDRGRLGFAFTTDLSENALRHLALTAVANAQSTEPDPFFSVPSAPSADYAAVAIYDPNIVNLTAREKIERVMALEREAVAVDPRIKRIRKAASGFSTAETIILNSRGAEVSYLSTACSASIQVVAEDKGESQAGSDFEMNRFYRKIGFEKVGRTAARRALDLLGARRIASLKAPVVLDAEVAQDFLSMMASGFSAENVQKKRSLLMGKLDQEIASSILTIHDDGLLEGGLGTAPSDDEAVPLKKKKVVDNGKLVLFLHNTYTAGKDKTDSTGNGMRAGFKGVPGVGVTNMYVEPGTCSLEELIQQAGKGLFVTEVMGMHTANAVSGDFSVGATGFWIEDGMKAYPVREITIAGNILDLMKNVEVVGCDLRFSGRIGSPSLLIKELSIAGK